MKYDRPVWQIMHLCADAMPAVFRYEDVRTWFTEQYPDVNEATIRAHLIGLTEGGRAKHVQFATRSPVFRRVARGEYEAIPFAERGEDPNAPSASASKLKMGSKGSGRPAVIDVSEDGEPYPSDVILLGSIGDRVNVPAPAKEIFREVSFQLSRLEAELSESDWFILSAEHGLVAPNEWISPDSRTLAEMDPAYRVVWASWVVGRLTSLVGSLDGLNVRVDAPAEFIGPLFADLQDAGAVVTTGSLSITFPSATAAADQTTVALPQHAEPVAPAAETAAQDVTAQYATAEHAEAEHADVDPANLEHAGVQAAGPEHVMVEGVDQPHWSDETETSEVAVAASIGAFLADRGQAVPATEAASLPDQPGLYGWHVDAIGARILNRCLMLPVREGLVFVGQVGGSSWHSLADPVLNVRDHVERLQLGGRTRASTFRMTLATVLREHLGMATLEDPKLTAWMLEHLSVTAWTSEIVGDLADLEQAVVAVLDPPLNVDHLPSTEYRVRLSQMRQRLG